MKYEICREKVNRRFSRGVYLCKLALSDRDSISEDDVVNVYSDISTLLYDTGINTYHKKSCDGFTPHKLSVFHLNDNTSVAISLESCNRLICYEDKIVWEPIKADQYGKRFSCAISHNNRDNVVKTINSILNYNRILRSVYEAD